LRIDYGPGLRVYFTEALDNTIVLLLVGGDKSHQDSDIRAAKHPGRPETAAHRLEQGNH